MGSEATGKMLIELLKAVMKDNKAIKAELDQLKQRVKILEDNAPGT